MKSDTTNNSWKSNLFLIAATAAVTTGLMALYNRYQHSKKSQDARMQQDAETQTNLIQTPPNRAAVSLSQAHQVTHAEKVAKKLPAPVTSSQSLSHVNKTSRVASTEQPSTGAEQHRDAAPAAQSGTEATEPSQPTSPSDALPGAKAAGLFCSHDGSYSLPPSCKNSENDLDRPRTPNNSETKITHEEQEKRGAEMFTEVAQTPAPAASGRSWPFG